MRTRFVESARYLKPAFPNSNLTRSEHQSLGFSQPLFFLFILIHRYLNTNQTLIEPTLERVVVQENVKPLDLFQSVYLKWERTLQDCWFTLPTKELTVFLLPGSVPAEHHPSTSQDFPLDLLWWHLGLLSAIPLPTASSQSRLLMIAECLVSRHKVVAGHWPTYWFRGSH